MNTGQRDAPKRRRVLQRPPAGAGAMAGVKRGTSSVGSTAKPVDLDERAAKQRKRKRIEARKQRERGLSLLDSVAAGKHPSDEAYFEQLALLEIRAAEAKLVLNRERGAKVIRSLLHLPQRPSANQCRQTPGSVRERPRQLAPIILHPDHLYRTAEVAQILDVSVKTVESWRYSGKVHLPFVRPAGARSVRYKGSDILAFIELNRRISTSD